MTLEEFKKISGNFFSVNDNWGDLSKVSINLVESLIKIEKTLQKKVYISGKKNSVYDEDKKNVYHNLGIAADIFVKCNPIEFLIKTANIKEIGCVGINFSNFWKKMNLHYSYHIDIRSIQNRKLWFMDENKNMYDLVKDEDYEKFMDCLYKSIFLTNNNK